MGESRRRATSADVAARAGVSRTTVSFVLTGRAGAAISEETRRRVQDAARELGYQAHGAARALAGGRSHTIGLVLLQAPEQVSGDAHLVDTLWGIGSEVGKGDYRVLVEPMGFTSVGYRDLLASHRVDGLIVSGPRSDDTALVETIGEGFPIVIKGSLPGIDVPSVDVDNRAGARLATDHLVAAGHRRIGLITNAPLAYTAAAERLAGYRDSLAAAGLERADDLVAEGLFDATSGLVAMRSLLERAPDLTAVFVASDVVAFGALAALRESGRRVPDDVSLVGFDDIPLSSHFDPPLTTVRVPARELGVAAGRALLDRLAGVVGTSRTLLPTQFLERSSVRTLR